ncbi:Glutathione S-transferase E14 [Lucilia cuprina]|nr:Glutathione S-transferase E14 [Lucilia cuprina]
MDQQYICDGVPILYYDALSSQARSCYMLIKLLNVNAELRPTDSITDVNFYETYTWLNSFCMLPTLVDENITLCNNHSILIYLCEKYAPLDLTNLCPKDYTSRLRIMSLLFYEGCLLYKCLGYLLTDIFLAKYPNFDKDYHRAKVSNIYKTLNTFLKGHFFMVGNRLTIADISIVSTVAALNLVFPIDYEKFPNLNDWLQRLRKMDFYQYNEEGIQKLRYLLEKIGKFPFPSPFRNKETSSESDSDTSDSEENKKSDVECKNETDMIKKNKEVDVNTREVPNSRNVKRSYKADKSTNTDSLAELFGKNESADFDSEKLNLKTFCVKDNSKYEIIESNLSKFNGKSNRNQLLDTDNYVVSTDDLTTEEKDLSNATGAPNRRYKHKRKLQNKVENYDCTKFAEQDVEDFLTTLQSLELMLDKIDKTTMNKSSQTYVWGKKDSDESVREKGGNFKLNCDTNRQSNFQKFDNKKNGNSFLGTNVSDDSSLKSLIEAKLRNTKDGCSHCNNCLFKHKRLKAGSNLKSQNIPSHVYDFPKITDLYKLGSKGSSDKIIQVIYHINMKRNSKFKNKYHWDISLEKNNINLNKSKIPRLISNLKRCKNTSKV